jgi:hypothetical protein
MPDAFSGPAGFFHLDGVSLPQAPVTGGDAPLAKAREGGHA